MDFWMVKWSLIIFVKIVTTIQTIHRWFCCKLRPPSGFCARYQSALYAYCTSRSKVVDFVLWTLCGSWVHHPLWWCRLELSFMLTFYKCDFSVYTKTIFSRNIHTAPCSVNIPSSSAHQEQWTKYCDLCDFGFFLLQMKSKTKIQWKILWHKHINVYQTNRKPEPTVLHRTIITR